MVDADVHGGYGRHTAQMIESANPGSPFPPSTGPSGLRITAYIPCYNGERTIGQAIASLFAQWHRPDEIIVVDDGSTDRSVEIALRYPVKVWRHKQNRGLAATRNTAINNATGELVAAIDADCFAEPSWLSRLARTLENDPTVIGAAGATVEAVQRGIADRWRIHHLRQHMGPKPIANADFLFGANTVFRRTALLAVGGYNPAMRTNGEDRDICTRLRRHLAGSKLAYDPRAIVQHHREDTIATVIATKWRYLHFPAAIHRPYDDPWDVAKRTATLMGQVWRKDLGSDLAARRFDQATLSLLVLSAMPFYQLRAFYRRRLERRQIQKDQAADIR
jgi:glycosyltransferase involved in cell wall biosynthesis